MAWMSRAGRAMVAALALTVVGVGTAAAHTATVGKTAPANVSARGGLFTGMQCASAIQVASGAGSPSYVVPFDGTITSWSYRGQPAGAQYPDATAQLQVYRSVGPDRWFVVAETGPHSAPPQRLSTFPAHIAVRKGDVLGLRADPGCAWFSRSAADSVLTFGYNAIPGLIALPDGPGFSNGRLNVSAVVVSTPPCQKHRRGRAPKRCRTA